MTWVLSLPYAKIPDGLSLNSRAHWRVKNRSTKEVRELVVMLARAERIPTMQRVQVELVWVVNTHHKRDVDNTVGLMKVISDALASDRGVSARLVPDDSPDYCVKLMPRIEYRKDEQPHFEVVVTDISHRPDVVGQIVKEREL